MGTNNYPPGDIRNEQQPGIWGFVLIVLTFLISVVVFCLAYNDKQVREAAIYEEQRRNAWNDGRWAERAGVEFESVPYLLDPDRKTAEAWVDGWITERVERNGFFVSPKSPDGLLE